MMFSLSFISLKEVFDRASVLCNQLPDRKMDVGKLNILKRQSKSRGLYKPPCLSDVVSKKKSPTIMNSQTK